MKPTSLLIALICTSCAPMAPHKLVRELKTDPAVFVGTIDTVYGRARLARVGGTTNRVVISIDGTVRINDP